MHNYIGNLKDGCDVCGESVATHPVHRDREASEPWDGKRPPDHDPRRTREVPHAVLVADPADGWR